MKTKLFGRFSDPAGTVSFGLVRQEFAIGHLSVDLEGYYEQGLFASIGRSPEF
jgi:hypothetical protein